MRLAPTIAALTLLVAATTSAEPTRTWMSADGSKSFRGKFVDRDDKSITFRLMPADRLTTVPVSKIHPKDIKWLDANHPLPGADEADTLSASGDSTASISSGPAVFGAISLGDAYADVSRKLSAEKGLELTMPDTMLGRTGLNGAYRTTAPMGGTPATLFFDWTPSRQLKELTLHGAPLTRPQAVPNILAGRESLIKELTKLHGPPHRGNPTLDILAIPDGGIVFSHVWKLQKQGFAMLGASCVGGEYQLTLRFTAEDL